MGAAAGCTAQGINTSYVHAAAPSQNPGITLSWVENTPPVSSLQVTVREMCCGCSSGSRREAWAGKCVGKCVWALPQQTGTVLGGCASLQHIKLWPVLNVEKKTLPSGFHPLKLHECVLFVYILQLSGCFREFQGKHKGDTWWNSSLLHTNNRLSALLFLSSSGTNIWMKLRQGKTKPKMVKNGKAWMSWRPNSQISPSKSPLSLLLLPHRTPGHESSLSLLNSDLFWENLWNTLLL